MKIEAIGKPAEWEDFEKRNQQFVDYIPAFHALFEKFFIRTFESDKQEDSVIFYLGRLCSEEFFEIFILCANGYGYGGLKILRSLYERAVNLAYEVIRKGGCCGAVLNAANESAVELFLSGEVKFGQIVPIVEDILTQWLNDAKNIPPHSDNSGVTLESLLQADAWARNMVKSEYQTIGSR